MATLLPRSREDFSRLHYYLISRPYDGYMKSAGSAISYVGMVEKLMEFDAQIARINSICDGILCLH